MITCCMCGDGFEGTRREAREARWEPYSNRTQSLLDHGPMVCPPCVTAAVERALAAARKAFAR